MKKVIIGSFFLTIAVAFASCDKPIAGFDNRSNYIYFNRPYILDNFEYPTEVRVDSIFYSFAMDDISVTSHTFDIPVGIVGLKNDKDRSYVVEVVPEKTTALDSEWDKSSIAGLYVRSGELSDTVKLKVNRLPTIKTEWHHITLRVIANDNFELGASDLLTIKVSFTDKIIPPGWWEKWQTYFGDFYIEKLKVWKEIYYLGADPNTASSGPGMGKPLYWDNMPYDVVVSWYPSTFVFIRILRQHFLDHEVFPDGIETNPRITIPDWDNS